MLVMTVKKGEGVVLVLPDGRQIRVAVGIHQPTWHSGKVRIAVEADREIVILRSELLPPPGTLPGGAEEKGK